MTGQRKYLGVHRDPEPRVITIPLVTASLWLLAIAVTASMVWALLVDLSLQDQPSRFPSPSPVCQSKQCASTGTARLTSNPQADRVIP